MQINIKFLLKSEYDSSINNKHVNKLDYALFLSLNF